MSVDRLIAKKQAMKQGMMQQLLTGKSRLRGFDTPWPKQRSVPLFEARRAFALTRTRVKVGVPVLCQVCDRGENRQLFLRRRGNILVPGEGNIGSIFHYINGKFEVHQRVYKVSDFTDEVVGKFIYYFMHRVFWKARDGKQR